MKKPLFIWQIAGFIFTGLFGVLLHFLVQLTGGNSIVASFSAVNESVWEHMKILFFPMFAFALIESRYIGKEYKGFWCVKLLGIILGVLLIPVIYYTLNGAFGPISDWVNIASFYVAAAVSYFVEIALLKKESLLCKSPKTAQAVLWLIAVVFVVLTFVTPQIPLFEDPLGGGYGF